MKSLTEVTPTCKQPPHLHECGYCFQQWRATPQEAGAGILRFLYRSLGNANTTETRNLGFICRGCGAATHDWKKGSPYHTTECPVGMFEKSLQKGEL